ncbi:hypothetical protein BLNAU_17668 [Blattamonas nauphoetae]|uniref:Uncharacterized protein n=1 Tax=Blattamonas nauphoetae TaxID=2049346 RepID=A0ABQ9X6U1_9EUKA|nr:hypothetical protein BLNAU_17668 [Blattamonas nauphoetae]
MENSLSSQVRQNTTNEPININVNYQDTQQQVHNSVLTAQPNGEAKIEEITDNQGTWTSVRVIDEITVNGKSLKQPFKNVSGPTRDYVFTFPADF